MRKEQAVSAVGVVCTVLASAAYSQSSQESRPSTSKLTIHLQERQRGEVRATGRSVAGGKQWMGTAVALNSPIDLSMPRYLVVDNRILSLQVADANAAYDYVVFLKDGEQLSIFEPPCMIAGTIRFRLSTELAEETNDSSQCQLLTSSSSGTKVLASKKLSGSQRANEIDMRITYADVAQAAANPVFARITKGTSTIALARVGDSVMDLISATRLLPIELHGFTRELSLTGSQGVAPRAVLAIVVTSPLPLFVGAFDLESTERIRVPILQGCESQNLSVLEYRNEAEVGTGMPRVVDGRTTKWNSETIQTKRLFGRIDAGELADVLPATIYVRPATDVIAGFPTVLRKTTTDEKGFYSMELPAGEWIVDVRSHSRHVLSMTRVTLDVSDIEHSPTCEGKGQIVIRPSVKRAYLPSATRPLQSWILGIDIEHQTVYSYAGQTYSPLLPRGKYLVITYAYPYFCAANEIDVTGGMTLCEVALEPMDVVRGRIQYEGRPVVAALVRPSAKSGAQWSFAVTDRAGYFELGLPPWCQYPVAADVFSVHGGQLPAAPKTIQLLANGKESTYELDKN